MPHILSISSHVVRGMVGNTLATFVLQRMGHAVWTVPTVIWDRHPGFGRPSGLALTGEQMVGLLAGFQAPAQAADTVLVISGYFANRGQIDAVRDHILALREQGFRPLYCCDPICGDAAGPYVAPEVASGLRTELLPLADIVTPNRHELGLLTGLPVTSNAEIVAAARALEREVCLVTSAFGSDATKIANLLVLPATVWLRETPRRDAVPNGAGDLMTALFVGWMAKNIEPMGALSHAATGLGAVLEARRRDGGDELAIVESQDRFARWESTAVFEVMPPAYLPHVR
jgi:pyridoxine kinase